MISFLEFYSSELISPVVAAGAAGMTSAGVRGVASVATAGAKTVGTKAGSKGAEPNRR